MESFMFHVFTAHICNVTCTRYGCAREELKPLYKFRNLLASSVHSLVNAWSPVKIADQNYIICSKCENVKERLHSTKAKLEVFITKMEQIFLSFHMPEC